MFIEFQVVSIIIDIYGTTKYKGLPCANLTLQIHDNVHFFVIMNLLTIIYLCT